MGSDPDPFSIYTTPEFVRRRASASRATATSSNGSTRSAAREAKSELARLTSV